jgi:hypothetical protein
MATQYLPNGVPAPAFDLEQIAFIWSDANPSQSRWQWTMAAIAWVESANTGIPNIVNNTPATGDYSVGLWQINYYGSNASRASNPIFGSPSSLAQNVAQQARAAAYLWANGAGLSNWAGDSVAKYILSTGENVPLTQAQAQALAGGTSPITGQTLTTSLSAGTPLTAGVPSNTTANASAADQISPPVNPNFPPLVALPPTPGFGDVTVSDIIINGAGISTDVTIAVTDVIVETSIANASTVTVELTDPTRWIIRSGIFNQGDSLELDGLNFTLVAFTKASDQLELVFESTAVYNLRQEIGVLNGGGTNLFGFAQQLVSAVPGLSLVGENDPLANAEAISITRGTSDDPDEDSWTCLVRLAATAGWRVWEYNNTIYFGSDPFWLTYFASYATLQEFTPQVMNIDFSYDWGQPFGNATVTAMTDYLSFPVGSPVTVTGLGPANGVWIINDMQRDLYNPEATVTLMIPMTPAELIATTTTNNSSTTVLGSPSTGTPNISLASYPANVPTTPANQAETFNSGQSFTLVATVSSGGFGGGPNGTIEFTYITSTGINPSGGTASPADFRNGSAVTLKANPDGNSTATLTSAAGLGTGIWQINAIYTPSSSSKWQGTDTTQAPLTITVN